MTRRTTTQSGLSLIEILIAMMVFATISAAMVGLMALTGGNQSQIERVSAQISTLERSRSIIRADLMQVIERPYRQPYERRSTSSFIGGQTGAGLLAASDGETILCAFVRNGWSNPQGVQPRASLQRVEYILRNDEILRRTRPFLDAAPDTPYHEQLLFAGVEDVSVQFRTGALWVNDWNGPVGSGMPGGFRLMFEHPHYGPLTQDFLVGAGDG